MRFLVVYFSYSGNNRLLAAELARRLDGEVCAVVERKRRTMFTTMLDLIFRRRPGIEPLGRALSDYDHVVFVAPLWASRIANPMQALLQREKDHIAEFSFISLSGYERGGQITGLEKQLAALVGSRPKTVAVLTVDQLLPEAQRGSVKAVSGYRVAADELGFYDRELAAFVKAIGRPG